MVIRSQYCNEKNEKEGNTDTMLFLVLETDDKKELLRVPLYLSADAKNAIPGLEKSLNDLPTLLNMIYNSGINQEEIKFIKEEVNL